jgi:hypothetical protein
MSRIKSIIRKKITTETLHNLAVEGDESYIANGIIVHNCRSVLVPIMVGEDEVGGYFANWENRNDPWGTDISADAVNPAKGFGG